MFALFGAVYMMAIYLKPGACILLIRQHDKLLEIIAGKCSFKYSLLLFICNSFYAFSRSGRCHSSMDIPCVRHIFFKLRIVRHFLRLDHRGHIISPHPPSPLLSVFLPPGKLSNVSLHGCEHAWYMKLPGLRWDCLPHNRPLLLVCTYLHYQLLSLCSSVRGLKCLPNYNKRVK